MKVYMRAYRREGRINILITLLPVVAVAAAEEG